MEDTELVKECLLGNDKAQTKLFEKYSTQMMSVCLRYTKSYSNAQDMLQDGFIKVYKKLNLYHGTGSLGAWIRRTIINNILDELRKEKVRKAHNEQFQIEYSLQNEYCEDELSGLTENQLLNIINQLPSGYKSIFNMYVIDDYTHQEIAEKLGISAITSRTQYRKSKIYIKKLIKSYEKKNNLLWYN